MGVWIDDKVKVQLQSTDHGVIKQLHSDIADKVIALQRDTLAWTGGYDMNVHGAKLTTALEKVIATCGTTYAQSRSQVLAKQHAPLIGTYRIHSRFLEVFRGENDNSFQKLFEKMGNQINDEYSKHNDKNDKKFKTRQRATNEEKLVAILKYFLHEDDPHFEFE